MRPARRLRGRLRQTPIRKPVQWVAHRGINYNDAIVASYPKSGNTWMKFLLAELALGREVGFDTVELTIPVVGKHRHAPGLLSSGGRLIKSHESFRPEYRRALYLVRDVRDVVVSYYYFLQGFQTGELSLDDFVRRFVAGRVDPYGRWEDHVKSWIEAQTGGAEVLVMRYEDLRVDPVTSLGQLAAFIGLETDVNRIRSVLDANELERMREKEMRQRGQENRRAGPPNPVGTLVRRGRVGDWRSVLRPRQLALLRPAIEFGVSNKLWDT